MRRGSLNLILWWKDDRVEIVWADVTSLLYMLGQSGRELLDNLLKRLDTIQCGYATWLDQPSLAEELFKRKWISTRFPKFKFREIPSTASVRGREKSVLFSWQFTVCGSYFRLRLQNTALLRRQTTIIFQLLRMYIWNYRGRYYAATVFPQYRHFCCLCKISMASGGISKFVSLLKDTVNIPLIFQLLILELAIDGLRLAAMNTPNMLSTRSV